MGNAARNLDVKPEEDIVKLRNVRLSFENLFQHETYEGKSTEKYTATFLIPKGSEQDAAVEQAIERAIARSSTPKKPFITTYQDGDEKDYDGYEGMMSLKASTKRRPVVIDRDRSPIVEDEAYDLMYSGMYVNASVTFNAGKDSYGKYRVWCNLRGVQRHRDGERFSSGVPVDVENEFDDFSDADDDLLD